jgi:hypothetical protein
MSKRIEEEPRPGALRIVTDTDARPEITVDFELSDVTDRAACALAADGEIYQRGGMLVHVVIPTPLVPGARSYPAIRELPMPTLRVRLAQIARWNQWSSKKQAFTRINVPDSIVSAVHSRGQWDDVRPLTGVITAPTIRADGSLLQDPGYDRQTGLLYWPDENFARIGDDERPSRDEARAAAESIADLACDFPFAHESGRSVWLASVLTLVGRIAITGVCPLFAFDANTRGSGKSLLVDMASMIAYGTEAARSSMSTVDEEMRKQITSILLSGSPVALLDNLRSGGKFGGPAFDSLLTSLEWKERLLGKTLVLKIPARTVWFATGNNMQYVGDLPRRTIRARVESPVDNPEDREGFKHGKGDELLRVISSRRKFLVTQALIVLRGHALAGRPQLGKQWGSFESWSNVVADAIRWVGLPDPLLGRVTEDESSDDDRLHIDALIDALIVIGRKVSARELVSILYPRDYYESPEGPDARYSSARDALETACGARGLPSPKDVGYALRRVKGRVVRGRCILGEYDAHAKMVLWSVSQKGQA